MRAESLLVLVLTRRCDRRCRHCPQAFSDSDMTEATLDAALSGLLPLLAAPARVKLFGGEPLLRPDLVERALDFVAARAPGTTVELPTNGNGLRWAAPMLARHPGVEVFASRPHPAAGRLPGAVHNLLLAPGESAASAARRLLEARRRGFRRVNVLPAYFTRWSPAQAAGLEDAFTALRAALARLAAAGKPVELVNLARRGSTPLYNDGLTVDADGEVYASNLVLAASVAPRRARLRLGSVADPEGLAERPAADPERVLEDSFPPEILECTRAADAALTRFCRAVEAEAVSPARPGPGARSGGGLSLA